MENGKAWQELQLFHFCAALPLTKVHMNQPFEWLHFSIFHLPFTMTSNE
jgi:hypothetical protein